MLASPIVPTFCCFNHYEYPIFWVVRTTARTSSTSLARSNSCERGDSFNGLACPKDFGHGSPIKTGFSHGPCIPYSHIFPRLRNNLTGKMRKRVPNPGYSCFSPKIFPCICHIAEPSGFGGTFQTNLHQERCYSGIFILQKRYWRFSSPIPHEEP